MKKLAMVLGAGRGQIPVIDLCHKYGWEVLVISVKGDYPGFKIAEHFEYIDVRDKEKVLEAGRKYGIKAVISDQLDEAVPTVAYVAERMGLSGIPYEVSLRFTDKYVMRQTAEQAGIKVPKCVEAATLEAAKRLIEQDSNMEFPVVIKPVDSSASRGVYKVNSFSELEMFFENAKSYSKTGRVIIEEFITGQEYVLEAYTQDYKVTNLIVGHRDYFDVKGTFIPNATVFTDADTADSHVEELLKETNQRLVESFGLNFGITHGEYFYVEETDEVYLVEIAARGSGVFVSSDLIEAACGINANDLLVRTALGLKNEGTIKLQKGAAAYFCYLVPKGTVIKVLNTNKVEKMDGVLKAFFDNIEVGMVSNSIRDKSSRKGPILVFGNSKADCYSIMEQVRDTLDIKIKTEDGIKNPIWK